MVLLTILGGVLISVASSLYLYFNGSIAGFSGILWGVVSKDESNRQKNLFFVSMLMANAFFYTLNNILHIKSDLYDSTSKQTNGVSILGFLVSGLMVGFGTKLGNGCTSGHGVCGLPRLSKRSWVFIIILMISAMATANFKHRFGLFDSYHQIQKENILTNFIVLAVLIITLFFFFQKFVYQWNNMNKKEIYQDLITTSTAALFSLGLILAGFVKREKVYNFLVISKDWDYSLMIILGVAVGLNFITFNYILKKGRNYYGEDFKLATNQTIDKKLVIGAVVFGIGWGISSLCPGPTMLLLQFATLKITFIFFGSMIAGQYMADAIKDFL